MRIAGIDPGLDGAVAFLPDGWVRDTPTATVQNGRKSKRVYLPTVMADTLRAMQPDHIVIESQQAFSPPGRRVGAGSMFSLGFGFGMWQGIAAALGIPFTLVAPQTWKAEIMNGMGKEKDASRVQAMRLFPQCTAELVRKKDDGRAEALLIAEYGRRHLA